MFITRIVFRFVAFSSILSACLMLTPTMLLAAMQTISTAKIYDLHDRNKHLYNFKNEFELEGDVKRLVSTYTDLNGKILVLETTLIKVGNAMDSLISYDLDHKQMGAKGRIELRDGRAYFSYSRDGDTKTATEKVGEDFIVSTMISGFLARNWEKIKKGETLKVRLGVADRRETVGFNYEKISESQDSIKVKMRPTSMIIAALVNPLIWTMSGDGSHLKELEGRSPVKVIEEKKFKDFDGYAIYTVQPTVDASK